MKVSEFLREARLKKGLGMRELCRKIEKLNNVAGNTVSSSYYCQVENQSKKVRTDKISMDFFWPVSEILDIDPMELFALSRGIVYEKSIKKRQEVSCHEAIDNSVEPLASNIHNQQMLSNKLKKIILEVIREETSHIIEETLRKLKPKIKIQLKCNG